MAHVHRYGHSKRLIGLQIFLSVSFKSQLLLLLIHNYSSLHLFCPFPEITLSPNCDDDFTHTPYDFHNNAVNQDYLFLPDEHFFRPLLTYSSQRFFVGLPIPSLYHLLLLLLTGGTAAALARRDGRSSSSKLQRELVATPTCSIVFVGRGRGDRDTELLL